MTSTYVYDIVSALAGSSVTETVPVVPTSISQATVVPFFKSVVQLINAEMPAAESASAAGSTGNLLLELLKTLSVNNAFHLDNAPKLHTLLGNSLVYLSIWKMAKSNIATGGALSPEMVAHATSLIGTAADWAIPLRQQLQLISQTDLSTVSGSIFLLELAASSYRIEFVPDKLLMQTDRSLETIWGLDTTVCLRSD